MLKVKKELLKQKLNPKRQRFWARAVGTYNRELDELRFGYGLTETEAKLILKNYLRFKLDRTITKLFYLVIAIGGTVLLLCKC